ncbi:uncharacterized protein LOC129582986 isoform X2 [Paramacrobiotus metropolitanus]|uniref:uncharacterized protein LOC129582986 isoform X2 n=1 Tax=Paramacrobiotus metropolitanus TaxID=2943436 RepID=UPI0024461809|nr:uncharacterized protein LOC129582986 isoform X2 [Paramacrobiotus metropolitanus]
MPIKTILIYFLEKESYSAYPEILTESTFVLWFACQICLQFGLRILPEWGDSRLDPDTDTYFVSLIELSGLEVNDCFWDDVMSGWIPPHPLTVARAEGARLVVDVPAASNRIIGYMATFLAVILTIFLSGSLIYLVCANRRWTYPISKDHLPYCRDVEAIIQKYRPAGKRHGPANIILILLCAMVSAVSFTIYYASWMVCCAIPVMLLWLSVILAITAIGPSAVFPGCILFASTMAVYCTGRIWRLWMSESYLALIKKGIRKLISANSTESRSSADRPQESRTAGTSKTRRQEVHRKKAACCFSAFFVGCVAVYFNVWPLFQQFPIVSQWQSCSANWTYWHPFNATGTCTKHGTYFDQGTAMLSYWVDLQSEELRSKPGSNTERLLSFTPSFSPAVSRAYLVWCGVLSVASGIPVMAVHYAEYIIVGIAVLVAGGLLVYRRVQACCTKWRRHAPDQRIMTADNRYKAHLLIVEVAAEKPNGQGSASSDRSPVPASTEKDNTDIMPHGDIINDQTILEVKDSHVLPVPIPSDPKVLVGKNTETTEPCLCEALSYMWFFAMDGVKADSSAFTIGHSPLCFAVSGDFHPTHFCGV